MESMRDVDRVMEREIKKGSTPLQFEQLGFGDYSYNEITSKEKLLQVLSYLLRIGEYEPFAGKTIGNNVYMDMRGKKAIFKRTRLTYERNNIFATIKRLAKKYKPDYEGKVYLETVRCFFTISAEELEKCRYNYKGKDTYAFVMSDRYIMALYTFGYIYKGDEHYISFGINENNKVIMWLGDIIDLNVEEQFYLRSENVPSDHSIGSEFYEAQIEVQWAEASAERKLLKKRLDFNEKVRDNYNLAVAQLDTETLRVAKNIRKLLVNTNDAFKDLIIPLNELFVEAINNKDISKDLKQKYPELKEELKGKKGIKLLQLWLEKNTTGIDVNVVIAPLFVLYDLRLVSAHLYSDNSREELLESCCTRLGLAETERNYIVIANTLIDKLDEMYDKFIQCLSVVNKGDEEDGE